MRLHQFIPLLSGIVLCLQGTLHADEAAERVLERVRHSAVLQEFDLTGHIKKKGKRFPVHLFLRGKDIQFLVDSGKAQNGFHMRLDEDQIRLKEIIQRKAVNMPNDKLDDPIKGTDVTYEDLAMRFLYWKDSKIEGSEKVRMQDCHKIRLVNPEKNAGEYKIVYVWVHKKFGALMKVIGYDQQGRPLKQFAVTSLQRAGDFQTLKKLQIDQIDPLRNKVVGQTYIEFDKPIRVQGKGDKPVR